MSRETAETLNTQVLIGDTAKRGRAWHDDEEVRKLLGVPDNHYEGAVPKADVLERLFSWRPEESPVIVEYDILSETGVEHVRIKDESRKAIIRPDTKTILGVFKEGYTPHYYDKWLLDEVAKILDQGLYISSAGVLREGAMAWVETTLPEDFQVQGIPFLPLLTGATSFDGSLATTFKRTVQFSVCDNTLSAALAGAGAQVKIKHSRNSNMRLNEIRDALELVHSIADDFMAQVEALSNVQVSEGDWSKFLDSFVGVPAVDASGRSKTMAENKRSAMNKLWFHDERVHPWQDTAFGVLQAVNTFTHHEGIVRGADRAERNQLRAITGGVDEMDRSTLETLAEIGVEIPAFA